MLNLTYSKNRILPTVEELPFSDEILVDNQIKNDIRYLTANEEVAHAEVIAN